MQRSYYSYSGLGLWPHSCRSLVFRARPYAQPWSDLELSEAGNWFIIANACKCNLPLKYLILCAFLITLDHFRKYRVLEAHHVHCSWVWVCKHQNQFIEDDWGIYTLLDHTPNFTILMVCEWMLVGWWLAKATYLTMLRIISKTMFSIFQHIYIYILYIYIMYIYIYIYIYYVYVYVYHLGFWTSCTVTVCNNHPKYSGSMFHPIHPSAAEELPAPHGAIATRTSCRSFCGKVSCAQSARRAGDPSFWPLDQGGGLYQNQFLPAERGGNKLTNWDTYAKWYDDMRWVIWTKESGVLPAKFGSQPTKSWVDMNKCGNWSTPNLDSTST